MTIDYENAWEEYANRWQEYYPELTHIGDEWIGKAAGIVAEVFTTKTSPASMYRSSW